MKEYIIYKLCDLFDQAVIAQLNFNFEESDKYFSIYYNLLKIYFKSENDFHNELLVLIDNFFLNEHSKLFEAKFNKNYLLN